MGNEEGVLKAQSAKLKAEVRSQKSEDRGQMSARLPAKKTAGLIEFVEL
jgi:hypothetical protein